MLNILHQISLDTLHILSRVKPEYSTINCRKICSLLYIFHVRLSNNVSKIQVPAHEVAFRSGFLKFQVTAFTVYQMEIFHVENI